MVHRYRVVQRMAPDLQAMRKIPREEIRGDDVELAVRNPNRRVGDPVEVVGKYHVAVCLEESHSGSLENKNRQTGTNMAL